MRAFAELRRAATSDAAVEQRLVELERETTERLGQHDEQLREIFEALRQLCASRTASGTASVREMSSGHGRRRSATIGGMADPDDPSRDPDVPPPPKLPDVESPPPEDVLDEVPPKEELVKRARSADEIVEEQPSVEELLDRDR